MCVISYLVILFYVLLVIFFFLRIRRPPRSTRTDTLFPYTTLFRSASSANGSIKVASAGEGQSIGKSSSTPIGRPVRLAPHLEDQRARRIKHPREIGRAHV